MAYYKFRSDIERFSKTLLYFTNIFMNNAVTPFSACTAEVRIVNRPVTSTTASRVVTRGKDCLSFFVINDFD